MTQYYSENLSAERLKRCYDIAPPRIRQYLEAEVDFVTGFISPSNRVLELGCGYGRILTDLSSITQHVVGIDLSLQSLTYDIATLQKQRGLSLVQMNAILTGFKVDSFDVVVCIQNGISAFKVDPVALFRECLRITKSGGKCLFSTYSDKIWEDRLEWFQLQSDEGLLGEIDWDQTVKGRICCKDGFKATTVSEDEFIRFSKELSVTYEIREVDSSSLFCILSSP
jgi:2-polyprenyl-6-hydroxyphenyl methylase/3-demethylubiquinone-9 3-methyltransferase